MRIVIDLQGAQTTDSRFRGIGRYSLALAQAMARQAGEHDILIALNGLFPERIEPLRAAFDGLIPEEQIVVWQAPGPAADINPSNRWRREAGERLREAFLANLKPDVVHVSSLFEGLSDDALTAVGAFESTLTTAVTLYDLIPLIYRDPYLANPVVESWYERKLGSLRRAQLWLAISESSRREGITWLNLPEEWVVNVSTAADAMFQPMQFGGEQADAIRQRYGLTRPFVMYTGGIDHRKNIEGLIKAYARLSASVRAGHQLAIVCSASEVQIDALKHLAARCGLARDELLLTGFIPDADMVALYNLCTAFVFPSWHEGFGLPALEAMSCGAAVIGANTSSMPELIGRADALFNPHDESDMAAKLHVVLTDDAFREQLKRHGLEQAKKFSWDNSARRALEAFERLHTHNHEAQIARIDMPARRRPHLAYVSPLPPERSGIADYSAELLPELARHYDIDVIVNQPVVTDSWIRANCPVRSAEWFDQNAHRYDRLLYHLGNSAFHQHMFWLLERHPGTVVLHDFFLSGAIGHMEIYDYAPGAWAAALYASHGYHAVKERLTAQDMAAVIWRYPANLAILQQANGVIVHSEFSRALADKWYGAGYSADWASIPLPRKPSATADRSVARASLGLGDEDFLICSFGMMGSTKLNHRLLTAWLVSPMAQDPRCHLVLVGENDGGVYGAELLRTMVQSVATKRVRITGFAPPALYRNYLEAANAAVQLRTLSRGETSAAVLDCMNYGLPTIINAHGAAAELPSDCVLRLPDDFSDAELQTALTQLWRDQPLRQSLGECARAHLRTHHHPRKVAGQYRDAIEYFAQAGPQARTARLVQAIAALDAPPADEQEWVAVAQAVAVNHPPPKGLKQLLVDISELVQNGAKSVIQQVVRCVLNELLLNPPEGYRIEPVYVSDDGLYRYARCFTMKLLSESNAGLVDEPMETTQGDVFLGLNTAVRVVPRYASVYVNLRQRGVGVFFIVYDLLCMKRPDCFVNSAFDDFSFWLRYISDLGDGAVCVSRAVADELVEWLHGAQPARQRPFKIGYFHLGANIDKGAPTSGLPEDAPKLLQSLSTHSSFLTVGTVESPKGHAQTVAAFEKLWNEGVVANLVIVGKQAWMVDCVAGRLRNHPELGKRLFWLEGISDEYLEKIYTASTAVIASSEGEDLGLPLIEAAQHKLPILARDLPVFREVAGEHAFYFSGKAPEDLAAAIKEWLDLYASGKAPCSDNIPRLTWQESAQQLIDVVGNKNWYVTMDCTVRVKSKSKI